jgi:hypothetical protein
MTTTNPAHHWVKLRHVLIMVNKINVHNYRQSYGHREKDLSNGVRTFAVAFSTYKVLSLMV